MSKTCGECIYRYTEIVGKCRIWKYIEIPADRHCCGEFEQDKNSQQTNGDKIRQMSNEELVDCIDELAFKFSTRREFLAYLNAPAESEGGDE